MLKNNFGFRLKYKSRTFLNALINNYGGNGIYNIKGENSKKNKNALLIYTAEAVSKHLSKTLSSFPELTSHSGFSESIELLKVLLDLGYTVDYLNLKETPDVSWNKYQLVIDAGNSIEYSKVVAGQKKIYYSTGCHWKTFYGNAYKHSESFYKRNKILLYPDRQLMPSYSDEASDIITCFGGTYQTNSFELNKQKVRQLNISTTFIPPSTLKKTIATKTKFMWYGGHGPFHKGLDLVVEAFAKMPHFELHIFGNIELNGKLFDWFQKKTSTTKNITYHGWATPDSKKFQDHVKLCDAIVFASSSEGGAGSVIQCLQFGLIPIINSSTAIDLSNTKFNIIGMDPEEEIDSIINNVEKFSKTDTDELQHYSSSLAKHYSEKNTLEMYSDSVRKIILSL
jgi:glycosyltransferase involved in cell wall biosynthesis